jgi:hypothetical protein
VNETLACPHDFQRDKQDAQLPYRNILIYWPLKLLKIYLRGAGIQIRNPHGVILVDDLYGRGWGLKLRSWFLSGQPDKPLVASGQRHGRTCSHWATGSLSPDSPASLWSTRDEPLLFDPNSYTKGPATDFDSQNTLVAALEAIQQTLTTMCHGAASSQGGSLPL